MCKKSISPHLKYYLVLSNSFVCLKCGETALIPSLALPFAFYYYYFELYKGSPSFCIVFHSVINIAFNIFLLCKEEEITFAFGPDSDEVCVHFQFQWEIISFFLPVHWDIFVL